jgi:hypothetical protein
MMWVFQIEKFLSNINATTGFFLGGWITIQKGKKKQNNLKTGRRHLDFS